MVDLPPEIWLRVMQFIPHSDLRDNLWTVNGLFLDIAMNLRWRQVLIMTRNTGASMHILERLMDPFVAKRVRYLILRLTHVKDPYAEPLSNTNKPLRQIQQTFKRVFAANKDTATFKRPHPLSTFSEVMDTLVRTAPNFTHVRELNIDCWDLPPSYDLQPLFASIWATFGPHLEGLVLGGNVEGYRDFIMSKPSLPRVRELQLELTNNLFKPGQRGDSDLEKLRVWSWALLDVSGFFGLLSQGNFPILQALNVRMAFDKSLHDPSGLKALLLQCSSTMESLELRLNPSGLPMNPASEQPLSLWLAECAREDGCLARLRYLDIYPTSMASGFDALLTSIERTEASLVELIVRDRYLLPTEAKIVVDAVSQCENLKYLRMNIWRLDVELIDHLAEKVPNISRLWISIGDTATNANATGGIAETFLQDLQGRWYTKWKLKDITIWQGGQEIDEDIMHALARSIPSIDSFFGNGHMHREDPSTSALPKVPVGR
ncbi:hypothetical protein NLJ89_g8416 [Agrocybe chaxingu]|uniref:F-box domain-containing protein n=1 Tax=Agrocybe chaxingu TaxID=84603 RepID=A0A9W8JVA7_9AGAR|nr:hypothetical protein NLJ89_g8416 [Agrocybe chaxingu]